MKKILLTLIVVLTAVFTSCKDEPVPSSTKEIVTFEFTKELNPEIAEDIKCVIDGYDIKLEIPKYTNVSALIPTFTHTGKKVYIGINEQVSGVTVRDFTFPVTYVVYAEDKTKTSYRVSVTFVGREALESLVFEKSKNPTLTADVNFSMSTSSAYAPMSTTQKEFIATFSTSAQKVYVDGVEQISGVTKNNFALPVVYKCVLANGTEVTYIARVDFLYNVVPHIYVETEGKTPVTSKDYYLTGTVRIDGKGSYQDIANAKTQIKGRGNSTWGMPKKPYRLKLDKKSEVLGLATEKDWVLLANHIDPTLMLNAVAFKIGHLLNLPYTNTAIGVDLTINGSYMGSYMLTEQVEISESRVNLNTSTDVLLEIDTYYDEDWKFKSIPFNMPVMVKDPDIVNQAHMDRIKDDFNKFASEFNKPIGTSNYKDNIDINSVVKYLIVYNLTNNMEINHPKSTYMYNKGGKYYMGPIWDFDWAYGFETGGAHFAGANTPLFTNKFGANAVGKVFFGRFILDPKVRVLYKEIWRDFRANSFNHLMSYIDAYSTAIRPSVIENSKKWSNTKNFDAKVLELKAWLKRQAEYIDREVNAL